MTRDVFIRAGKLVYDWGWNGGSADAFLKHVSINGDIRRAVSVMNASIPKSCPPVTMDELVGG